MKQLIIILFMVFPLSLFGDQTGNLLNQNFTNSSWTGTNQSSRHGTGTIAGVDGKYVESTISLSDTLTESQINNGWTSTLGADIWHWNNLNSTTTMKQTITDANGTVTTQIREVANTGCGYINCGDWATYTDSYTQGINSQSDYDIAVRFTFDESSNSSSHYGTDLKNPTLTIIHSLISAEQAEELSTMSETVYNTVEEIDFYEYIPEEEFNFEMTEQPTVEISTIEEFYFEPQAIEELNAGVVDVFQEIIYDDPTTIETFSTEIEIEEVYVETAESFSDTSTADIFQEFFETRSEEGATNYETSDTSRIIESEPLREKVSEGGDGEITTEEVARAGDGEAPRESEERIADEPGGTASAGETTQENVEETQVVSEEPTTEDTVVAEEEITDESVGEGEATDSESGDGGTEVADSGEETIESRDTEVEESRSEGSTRVNTETITVESIEKKVNETLKRVDQRLIATSLIVAKAMESPISIEKYGQTNNNIFNNQLNIDGGEYYETRNYIDNRDIYAEAQISYNDPVQKYQKILQESLDNRIRAEEHLRRIRGF